MIDYLYDGTFEGILTCIYHHYYTEKADRVLTREEYQPSLLHGYMEVETNPEKATKVYDAVADKISGYALRTMYRAYLSANPGKGTAILQYAVLGFRKGYATGFLRGDPVVDNIEKLVKKVSVEQERMLQFVRFQVMADGILYGQIEPEHNVLELIAGHFADRFRHDPFIIRDVGRNRAIFAYEGHWYISDFDGESLPDGRKLTKSRDEAEYQQLWKTYFDNIAIMERKNPRCQKNFMPVRYWKHLTEML